MTLLKSILCLIAAGLIMWLIAPAWLYVVLITCGALIALGLTMLAVALFARGMENLERDRT